MDHTNKINGFNVRVYGICIKDKHILLLEEPFMGKELTKFPGGGLEFGEGTVDCLKREFEEELNLVVKAVKPYYIQEDYVPTLAKNNLQIVLLYFLVEYEHWDSFQILDSKITNVFWHDLSKDCPLVLPIDQKVYEKLQKDFL